MSGSATDVLAISLPVRWTSRIASLSVALLLLTFFLHRLFGMPTPVAINLVKVAIGGGLLSILLAIAGIFVTWRTGSPGVARIVFGLVFGVALVGWPLLFLPTVSSLPTINDVTTYPATPPPFVKIAQLRPSGSNPVDYPGEKYAKKQAKAYPDLKPLVVNRSSGDAFQVALDAVKRMHMQVVNEKEPGGDESQPGLIEATDKTMIVGFVDDVAVRVYGSDQVSRIDVRSASRYGRHDLGRNAERVRELLQEIVARLEATVPTALEQKAAARKAAAKTNKKKTVKKAKKKRKKRRKKRRRRKPPPQFF